MKVSQVKTEKNIEFFEAIKHLFVKEQISLYRKKLLCIMNSNFK